jgi:hypothetical protein
MLGLGRLEIERLYSSEVSAPEPLYVDAYGLYLEQDEVMCRLQVEDKQSINQEGVDENKDSEDEDDFLLDLVLEDKGITRDEFLSGAYGDLTAEDIDYITYLINQKDHYGSLNNTLNSAIYDDAMSFKEQSYQFVIKTIELDRFTQSIQEELSDKKNKPSLSERESSSYFKLIRALLLQLEIEPDQRGVATSIQEITELRGNALSQETIRKILLTINNC